LTTLDKKSHSEKNLWMLKKAPKINLIKFKGNNFVSIIDMCMERIHNYVQDISNFNKKT